MQLPEKDAEHARGSFVEAATWKWAATVPMTICGHVPQQIGGPEAHSSLGDGKAALDLCLVSSGRASAMRREALRAHRAGCHGNRSSVAVEEFALRQSALVPLRGKFAGGVNRLGRQVVARGSNAWAQFEGLPLPWRLGRARGQPLVALAVMTRLLTRRRPGRGMGADAEMQLVGLTS